MNALRLRNRRENVLQSSIRIVSEGQQSRAIAELVLALQDLDVFFAEEVEEIRDLGRGASFRVACCKSTVTNHLVAVKSPLGPQPLSGALMRELKLAKHSPFTQHPNITRLLGVMEPQLGEVVQLSLVYEYSALGTLGDLFGQQSHAEALPYGLPQAHSLAVDIAAGLEALHAYGVAHGDIKPDNILLFPAREPTDRDTQIRFVAKLNDFGSAIIDDSAFSMSRSRQSTRAFYGGTPVFVPEFVSEMGGEIPFHLAPLCDIYSLGLTIWSIYRRGYFFSAVADDVRQLAGECSSSWQSVPWLRASYADDTALAYLAAPDREKLDKVMDISVFMSNFSHTNPIAPLDQWDTYGDPFTRVHTVLAVLTG